MNIIGPIPCRMQIFFSNKKMTNLNVIIFASSGIGYRPNRNNYVRSQHISIFADNKGFLVFNQCSK